MIRTLPIPGGWNVKRAVSKPYFGGYTIFRRALEELTVSSFPSMEQNRFRHYRTEVRPPYGVLRGMNDRARDIARSFDLPLPGDASLAETSGEHEAFPLSENSLRSVFENAPDALLICDCDGTILTVNAETERLFGYGRHELIGGKVERLIPERLRGSHEQQRVSYSTSPTSRLMSESPTIFGLRRDGSEIPLAISLNRVESRNGLALFAIIHDISVLVAAQKRQRETDFERMLAELSAKFVNLAPERVDGEIRSGLQSIGEALGGDRATIALAQPSGEVLATYAWAAPGFPEYPRRLVELDAPWVVETVLSGRTILGRPNTLPPEAEILRAYMEKMGVKTDMIVPFRVGGQVIGGLAVDAFRQDQPWDQITLSRLQAAADVLANALVRKQSDEQLRKAYAEISELRDRLEKENRCLREEIKLENNHSTVVGTSQAIRNVLRKAEQVAETDSTVLIMGETGTGKELIARSIHELSRRRDRPLVKVNCAALPGTLIESELFGREKGAYTGALAREIGRFEIADHSTIFLDEVGEIPTDVQAKLLRVLQEGQFERLGSSRTISVDVRVIAATNRDLSAMVKDGKFREDLYYRLNVFPILVPPLRERTEDIPALVWHILKELRKRMGKKVEEVHAGTMETLQRFSWPGNVRELRNVIERNLILTNGPIFRLNPEELQEKPGLRMMTLDEIEANYIRTVLQSTNGRIRGRGGAAEILGLKPTTLDARMKKLHVHRPE